MHECLRNFRTDAGVIDDRRFVTPGSNTGKDFRVGRQSPSCYRYITAQTSM